jgi:putative transposase
MPWQSITPMSQRLEFIRAVVEQRQEFRAACRAFGISEKTGYKWRARFLEGGPVALADRSHAPHVAAHQVSPGLAARICALREAHPTWGARKLREVLATDDPATSWPAPSTITTLLKRAGLVQARRRSARERSAWASTTLTQPHAPNDVWAADFKGEFRCGDGAYCYPLTVSDLHSRFVLACAAHASTASTAVQAHLIRVFQTYGLPRVIRTDNGAPFGAPVALGGLSALAVWWVRLGIRPERIHKGEPQENGAHERMHRTLKADTTRPPAATLSRQEQRFVQWRRVFNERRPHEAIGMVPPATRYHASPRAYPRRLPILEYPGDYMLRRVEDVGCIKIRNVRVFLTTVLKGEYVALQETSEATWTIRFGPLQLGVYDAAQLQFVEAVRWVGD